MCGQSPVEAGADEAQRGDPVTSTMNPPSDTGGKPASSDKVPGSSQGRLGSELIARLVQQVHTVEPREMRTSVAPFTGDPVGDVPSCTAEDVDAAVKRARAAQVAWAKRPVKERAAIFSRWSPWISTAPPFTVPPEPQCFLRSFATVSSSRRSGRRSARWLRSCRRHRM